MLTYHNNPLLKETLLKKLKQHKEADQLVQGYFTNNGERQFRGCSIGCVLRIANEDIVNWKILNLEKVERAYGIPIWLADFHETLFERAQTDAALEWPEMFFSAINVGVDYNTPEIKLNFQRFIQNWHYENVDRAQLDTYHTHQLATYITTSLAFSPPEKSMTKKQLWLFVFNAICEKLKQYN